MLKIGYCLKEQSRCVNQDAIWQWVEAIIRIACSFFDFIKMKNVDLVRYYSFIVNSQH